MKIVLWCFAIVLAIVLLCVFWPRGESVETYRGRLIAAVNQTLLDPNHPIRQKIESNHVTVTVKSARVTACTIQTVNGSDNAGKDGSNVATVDLVITAIWDGYVHKDGFTEVEVLYDNQNKITKETRFLRSNAVVNLDKVNWFDVGYIIGQCIGNGIF